MYDLWTGQVINRPPLDTVIERHVWLGQDALLLSCERIGMGSIIGARALVKGSIPARVAAAGTPARVLREGVSWGRHPYSMSSAERLSIGMPERPTT
jgi:acetyltransferase-like isoleucine patch superfamily enzyme